MTDLNITKAEWKFVGIFSIIIIAITCLPYLYGYFAAPENSKFMGHHFYNIRDTYTYLAWMQQAQEGHLLFKSLYTSEPQKAVLFQPLFLAMGIFARIFNFSNIFTFHLFRVFLGFIFLFTSYIFISCFLKDQFQRGICFLFLIFSSGFRWVFEYFFSHFAPAETFMSAETIETTTFYSLMESPLNLTSFTLMLLAFLLILKAFERQNDNKTVIVSEAKQSRSNREKHGIASSLPSVAPRNESHKYAILAGFSLFLISLIHTYDIFIVLLVGGLYVFFKIIPLLTSSPKRRKILILLKNFGIMILILIPGILYNYYVINHNQAFSEWAKTSGILPAFSLLDYIAGFGIIFFLALIGLLKIIKNKNQEYLFIFVWIIASILLVSQPIIHFQRKFTDGLHIAIVILATVGLFFLLDYFKKWWKQKGFSFSFNKVKALVLTIIISFTSISNILTVTRDIDFYKYVIQNPKEIFRMPPVYLDKSFLETIHWLKENTPSSQIILSDPMVSNLIPGISGNTVFVGYTDQTMDYSQKKKQLKWFIEKSNQNEKKYIFLKENNISYFLYSPDFFSNYNLENFHPEKMEYLKPVYKNEKAVIYKVL